MSARPPRRLGEVGDTAVAWAGSGSVEAPVRPETRGVVSARRHATDPV
ncbi:hypothetical protein SUDANB43_05969 [Streptomyces sp. enrichment culture]